MAEEHKTKIVVEGDVSGAVSGLGKLSSAFKSVAKVASTVTRALGIIGFAVHGVQALIEGYKKVQEWMNRAATAAKEFQKSIEADRHASAIAAVTDEYKRLNDEISKAAKLTEHLNGIEDKNTATKRDREDAKREQNKQAEISKLNPYDFDYDEKKSAIERKYAREEADVAESRAYEDSRARIDRLSDQAKEKDKEASALEKILIKARGEKKLAESSGDDKAFEESKKKVDELSAKIAEAKLSAQMLRDKIALEDSGTDTATVKSATKKQQLANEAARASAKKEQEQIKKDDESAKKRSEREEKYAKLTKKFKQEDELASAEKRLGALQEMAGNGSVGVSQNRLTAMGLGSGVSGPIANMSGDIHKMVDLLKAQIEATKKLQRDESRREALEALF